MISFSTKVFLYLPEKRTIFHPKKKYSLSIFYTQQTETTSFQTKILLYLSKKRKKFYTHTKKGYSFFICFMLHIILTIVERFFLFFFCTQPDYIPHLQGDFYITHNNIVAFFLFLLRKDFDIFHEPFLQSFFVIFVIFS